MCQPGFDGLTRRGLIAGAASATVVASASPLLDAAGAQARTDRNSRRPHGRPPRLGSGGSPTGYPHIARLAREHGAGEPIMFVDLAAVDQNARVISSFARQNGWAVRPALKAFQCPELCNYVMGLLPERRGLIFHLRLVDQLLAVSPPGLDLMMGYPPTRGELRAFLGRPAPRGQPAHRLRILVSSLDLLEELAALARVTPRRLPLEVGLEFNSGEGRGGFQKPQDISAAIRLLRAERKRLRLTAVLCYDGHATLNGNEQYRRGVALQAQQYYASYLAQLRAEGADLYDERTLVRNGPASANYRNWAGSKVCNEISPGSAFMYAGYLSAGYDNQGLASAMTQCAPVLKVIGPYPSVPVTKTPLPGDNQEEYFLKGSTWPDQGGNQPAFVYPAGVNDDQLEGGRAAVYAPQGELGPEDYVLCWPNQSGDGADYFGALQAIRNGRLLATWPTFSRWSTPAAGPYRGGTPERWRA